MKAHRPKQWSIVDPVQWHEGMLLGPHHFQQSDLRVQQLFAYHLSRCFPYFWGVVRLKVDPVFLVQGIVRVLDCEAIMPDGTVVMSDQEGGIPDFSLADVRSDLAKGSRRLHLAIPAHRPGVGNASGPAARYASHPGQPVVDENTGDNPVVVPRWQPRLQWFLGERPSHRYVSLPVAEIVLRDNAFAMSSYVPPHIHVDERSPIAELCQQTFRQIREKMAFLLGPFKDMPQAALPGDTVHHLNILSAALVPCETEFYAALTHPLDLYKALCRLAGQLASLRCTALPPLFDPYDHEESLACFQKVSDTITSLLRTVEDQYESLIFSQQGRFFELSPHRAFAETRLVLGIKTPSSGQDDAMVAWLREAVIVKKSSVQSAQERRILGAKRRLIERDDALQISAGSGLTLCEVQGDPLFIRTTEPLVVFNMSDTPETRPADIILYSARDTVGVLA